VSIPYPFLRSADPGGFNCLSTKPDTVQIPKQRRATSRISVYYDIAAHAERHSGHAESPRASPETRCDGGVQLNRWTNTSPLMVQARGRPIGVLDIDAQLLPGG